MNSGASSTLSSTDHNVTAPLCHEYIRWLPEEQRSHAWAVLSGIVSGLQPGVKYELANSLLVTFRNSDTATYTEHTAWGQIVLEAAGAAQEDSADAASAGKLVSDVLVFARERFVRPFSV